MWNSTSSFKGMLDNAVANSKQAIEKAQRAYQEQQRRNLSTDSGEKQVPEGPGDPKTQRITGEITVEGQDTGQGTRERAGNRDVESGSRSAQAELLLDLGSSDENSLDASHVGACIVSDTQTLPAGQSTKDTRTSFEPLIPLEPGHQSQLLHQTPSHMSHSHSWYGFRKRMLDTSSSSTGGEALGAGPSSSRADRQNSAPCLQKIVSDLIQRTSGLEGGLDDIGAFEDFVKGLRDRNSALQRFLTTSTSARSMDETVKARFSGFSDTLLLPSALSSSAAPAWQSFLELSALHTQMSKTLTEVRDYLDITDPAGRATTSASIRLSKIHHALEKSLVTFGDARGRLPPDKYFWIYRTIEAPSVIMESIRAFESLNVVPSQQGPMPRTVCDGDQSKALKRSQGLLRELQSAVRAMKVEHSRALDEIRAKHESEIAELHQTSERECTSKLAVAQEQHQIALSGVTQELERLKMESAKALQYNEGESGDILKTEEETHPAQPSELNRELERARAHTSGAGSQIRSEEAEADSDPGLDSTGACESASDPLRGETQGNAIDPKEPSLGGCESESSHKSGELEELSESQSLMRALEDAKAQRTRAEEEAKEVKLKLRQVEEHYSVQLAAAQEKLKEALLLPVSGAGEVNLERRESEANSSSKLDVASTTLPMPGSDTERSIAEAPISPTQALQLAHSKISSLEVALRRSRTERDMQQDQFRDQMKRIAAERDALTEELRGELQKAQSQLAATADELELARTQRKEHQELRSELSKTREVSRTEKESTAATIQRQKTEIDGLRVGIKNLKAELHGLSNERKRERSEHEELKLSKARLEKVIVAKEKANETSGMKLKEQEEELQELRTKVATVETEKSSLEDKIEEMERLNVAEKENLEALQSGFTDTSKQLDETRRQLDEIRLENDTSQSRLRDLSQEVEQVRLDAAEKQDSLRQAKSSLELSQKEVKSFQNEHLKYREQVDRSITQMRIAEEKLVLLQNNADQARGEKEEFRRLSEEYADQLDRLKRELKDVKEHMDRKTEEFDAKERHFKQLNKNLRDELAKTQRRAPAAPELTVSSPGPSACLPTQCTGSPVGDSQGSLSTHRGSANTVSREPSGPSAIPDPTRQLGRDYLRHVFLQFLEFPDRRTSLMSVMSALLDCSQDEKSRLEKLVHAK